MEMNELCDLLMQVLEKALTKWMEKHPEVSPLKISQQLYLVGGKIREMGYQMQEKYRTENL